MKTKPILLQSLHSVIGLFVILVPSWLFAQTSHTWIGDDTGSWGNPFNWDTNQVPQSGDSLIFGGDYTYSYNELTGLTIRNITFSATSSDAFIVEGNAFNIGGTLTNQSDYDVLIANNLQVVAGGGIIPNGRDGNRQGLILDTGHGGITLAGSVAASSTFNVIKTGSGVLTLEGGPLTTWQMGQFQVWQGTLQTNGGTLVNGTEIFVMGSGWIADQPETFGSATAIFNGTTGKLAHAGRLHSYSGANQIVIENGADIFVENSDNWRNDGAHFPVAGPSTPALATLNIDLTHAGSGSMNVPGSANGLYKAWITVTESTLDGNRTGLAWVVNGTLTRATSHLQVYTGGAFFNQNSNMATSGHTVTVAPDGNVWVRSLTITGTGSISGPNSLYVNSTLMMEEGVGDYLIDKNFNQLGSESVLYIHQYSTDGVLTFGRDILSGKHIAKTGPGTVVFSAGRTYQTAQVEIQGGGMVVNGAMNMATADAYLRVRGADAVLSGQGEIGGGNGTVYTQVQVFNGGTLEGNNHETKALDITGSLRFLADGNYRMALHENTELNPLHDPLTVKSVVAGANPQAALLTLAGNLELSLHYDLNWQSADPIILLRTDGTISGAFTSINGSSFIGGNQFFLTYNSEDYWFAIDYAYALDGGFTAVALHAIPEPSTVGLLLGTAMMGCFYVRKKRLDLLKSDR